MYHHKYLSGNNWVFLEKSIDTISSIPTMKFNWSSIVQLKGLKVPPCGSKRKCCKLKKNQRAPTIYLSFPPSPWDRSHTTLSGPELTMYQLWTQSQTPGPPPSTSQMLRLQMGSPHPVFTSCFSKWEEGVLACSSAVIVPAFEPRVQPPVAHKARYGGNHQQSQELRKWRQRNQELIHANLGYLKSSSPAWAAWMDPTSKNKTKQINGFDVFCMWFLHLSHIWPYDYSCQTPEALISTRKRDFVF